MTSNHIFFIPSVFFLGFFAGAVVVLLSSRRYENLHTQTPKFRIKGSLLAIAFGTFIAMFVLTHMFSFFGGAKVLHASLGHRPLFDQQTSASADEVYARIEAFGEIGREAYRRFTYTADVIFPLSILFFLVILSLFVIERTSVSRLFRRILVSIPFLWFSADMLENSIIFHLISEFPNRLVLLANTLGLLTQIKFLLLLSAIGIPAILFATFRRNPKIDRP